MPAALSVDSFVDLAQRSRLVSSEQMQEALKRLEEEGVEAGSPEALAAALVKQGLLTNWQVGHLLKGKHNGFFLGSYRFLKMLGKGGMGAVYLAEHEMMRRRCAIKVLPTKLINDSSSVLERFYLEAQAVAALDDPNIVRAYDVNKEVQGKREIHYLVMEYVDGCDLQVMVEREGPLDFVKVADFSRQAASGLAHAHAKGLIHRDIKPANLLIDSSGTVKILDLGLARFFDDRLEASLTTTHNESILGTADYLSPEQALDSHKVDTRTDIYSLGCTCYFMLTGQPPFPDGSVAQRLLAHQVKSPTAIEKLRSDVPVDLVTIVEQMIAKSADDRYQTSDEVAEAFGAWLAQHADDTWKATHREVVDGSATQARREPTRATSAPTEDTDVELGLAPTAERDTPPAEVSAPASASAAAATVTTGGETELGLDELEELEELDPTAASPDLSSSSSGIDDLLTEALENYPAFDSNVNLAGVTAQSSTGSGVKVASQASDKSEQTQLFKLILIGLGVSIPLAVVILFVSLRFSTPPAQPTLAGGPGVQAGPVPGPESVPPEPPAVPPDDAGPSQTDPPPSDGTKAVEPATTGEDKQKSTPQTNEREQSADPGPGTPVSSDPTEQKTAPDRSSSTSPPSTQPPPDENPTTSKSPTTAENSASTTPAPRADGDPPPKQATGGKAKRNGKSKSKQPEPTPPSPAQIKQLLAGLSRVTIKLDREKKNNYDLMVLRTAEEALDRAGLKASIESGDESAAVLTLSFEAEKAEPFVVFNVGAELKCRNEESQEVSLWKLRQEVAKFKPNALGPTPPALLRTKVSDFYDPLVKQYKQAVAANR